jgi:hypothetical protein
VDLENNVVRIPQPRPTAKPADAPDAGPQDE